MQPILSEYYGDNTRWFVATVIDSSPPFGREGRVKIRIHGLHTENTQDIPQNDLPWAQCVLPTTEGGVSGIGRVPNIQPNALVFGLFMDGVNSQVPIVIGSLPRIETPTGVQLQKTFIGLGSDVSTKNVFEENTESVDEKGNIDNTDLGEPNFIIKRNREKTSVNFFLNVGYTVNQAIGITAGLTRVSRMTVGKPGIGSFSDIRYNYLTNFKETFNSFTTQLKFVLYELNTSKTDANVRLLQTDKIEGKNSVSEVISKYYLERKVSPAEIEKTAKELIDRIV
jgi:hypothetical protein